MYANVHIAPVIAEKHIYDSSHVPYRELNIARTNFRKKMLKIFLFLRLKRIVCSYHVTCFYSKSALCNCLYVKEILARNRHDIWNSNDSNKTRNNNLLACNELLTVSPKWPNYWAVLRVHICIFFPIIITNIVTN